MLLVVLLNLHSPDLRDLDLLLVLDLVDPDLHLADLVAELGAEAPALALQTLPLPPGVPVLLRHLGQTLLQPPVLRQHLPGKVTVNMWL